MNNMICSGKTSVHTIENNENPVPVRGLENDKELTYNEEFHDEEDEKLTGEGSTEKKPPTKAFIRINIFQIGEVDTVACTFAAHFYVTATWSDPKLTIKELNKDGNGRQAQSDIIEKSFDPKIMFMNTAGVPEIEDLVCPKFYREKSKRGPKNALVFSCRYGVTARFHEQFELKDFPFDKQPLNIVISSDNHDDVINLYGYDDESLVRKEFMVLNEYEMSKKIMSCRARTVRNHGHGYPLLYTGVFVERNYGYYLWNVFLPIFLITLMSVTTFVVPLDQVADRCGVILTLLLTSVAFKFVVGQGLPKISYNTYLDTYVLVSFIVLTFIALGVAFVGFLDEHVSTEAAINTDKVLLNISVGVFVIWHIYAFVDAGYRIRKRKNGTMGPSKEALVTSNGRLLRLSTAKLQKVYCDLK